MGEWLGMTYIGLCGSMYVLNRDVYKMGLFMCYKVRYVLYWSIYVLYRDMYVLYG